MHDTREIGPLSSLQVPTKLTCEMLQTCIERLCNYFSGDDRNAPAEIPMHGRVSGVPAHVFTDFSIMSVHKLYIMLIQFEVTVMSKLGHRVIMFSICCYFTVILFFLNKQFIFLDKIGESLHIY